MLRYRMHGWQVRVVLLVLLVLWMLMIFGFSAQNGEESSGISMTVSEFVAEGYSTIVEPDMTDEEVHLLAVRIEHPVRKIAHMTEYAILALLAYLVLYSFWVPHWKNAIVVAFCFVYALIDEFHQLFVAGRTARFTDCCIDTLGALVMMLLVFVITAFYHRRRQKVVL